MLKRARIKNFQSHKDTVIEFVEGTNVVIGSSDTGKSALFRAINWVCSNRPLGDAFRSEWGGDTSVTLETTDGHIIERVKGASRNEYIVDGEVLKAFGTEVPDLVTDTLQIDVANISAQMDPPFLLASTPGEAARLLNTAASIDVIDRSISKLRKTQASLNSSIKHNLTTKDGSVKQLDEYADLEEIEVILQEAEKTQALKTKKELVLTEVKKLHSRGMTVNTQLEKTAHIMEAAELFDVLEGTYQKYLGKNNRNAAVKIIIETATGLQTELSKTNDIPAQFVRLERIQKDCKVLDDRKKALLGLQTIVVKSKGLDKSIKTLNTDLTRLTEQYEALVPETCPLCGNAWEGAQ